MYFMNEEQVTVNHNSGCQVFCGSRKSVVILFLVSLMGSMTATFLVLQIPSWGGGVTDVAHSMHNLNKTECAIVTL